MAVFPTGNLLREGELAELAEALQEPGPTAKWAEIRRIAKTHHPEAWRSLMDLK